MVKSFLCSFKRGQNVVLNTPTQQLTMLVSAAPGDLVPSSGFCGHPNTHSMHTQARTHIDTFFKSLAFKGEF